MADLAKELEKAIGGNSDKQEVKHFLDTGYPPLNKIISGKYDGGIACGRITEMFGPSSSGKTAIAMKLMIEAQRVGGVAMFMDHERSFDLSMAKLNGLNDAFPQWIYKQPRTWEESNKIAALAAKTIRESKAISAEAPILVVFDSVAAMIPRSVLEKVIDEYNMNDSTALARATSQTLKLMAQFAEDFNMTLLYLNQIRTKPGVVYGDPTTTPGGQSMEFFATSRIQLARKRIIEDKGDGKELTGQVITVKIVKSKLTRPFQETEMRFMFKPDGSGYFDNTGSLLDYLVDKKIIASGGSRVTWTDGKSYYRKALIEKIESEKLEKELIALVPID
jgi:recombination protein RecA